MGVALMPIFSLITYDSTMMSSSQQFCGQFCDIFFIKKKIDDQMTTESSIFLRTMVRNPKNRPDRQQVVGAVFNTLPNAGYLLVIS
jgi:hypothetical protein